jgi:hypothetical protein
MAAVLVAGAVVAILLLHPFSHNETAGSAANSSSATPSGPASPTTSAPVSPTPSASASVSPTPATGTEKQAATGVAGMLTQSVSDRSVINNAYNDVDRCGPNLTSDAGVFTRAANSRTAILANLAAMPGRSALPPALLSNLTQAWQASAAADKAFATWANDESTQGCVPNDTSNPGYQATVTPDTDATRYKTAFIAQWNPIATRYNLTTYQQDQL